MDLQKNIESALRHHQAGRLAEAEKLYRQVLSQQPQNADALHLLGVLAGQTGNPAAAVDLIRQAIASCSTNATLYSNLGNALADAGRHDEATHAYAQAIRLKPDYIDVHVNLGNALQAKGKIDEAIASYQRAIQLKPDLAVAYANLGNSLQSAGKTHEAVTACEKAIQLKPDFAEAHANLGNSLQKSGLFEAAIAAYQRALQLNPRLVGTRNNLGNALQAVGRSDEAIEAFGQAVLLQPNYAEAHNNLGNVCQRVGRLERAVVEYRLAIRLNSDYVEAHTNLGNVLTELGRLDEAIGCFEQAIRLKPQYAGAHSNLGIAWSDKGRLDESVASLRRATQLNPGFAEAYNNLGNTLKDMGQLDDAIASYRQATILEPDHSSAGSNLLYAIHFHPAYDGTAILNEHRRWSEKHAAPLKRFAHPHKNHREFDRPLKIGYVSADFREHPVGYFIYPLLEYHNRDQFMIYCYSNVRRPDQMTERLQDKAGIWRNIVGVTDEEAARQIREDQIDVLVDLTMHMAGNRLLMFARKPAPVQVTYLAYCSTTGLDIMDYRFTDPYLDPSPTIEGAYTEKSWVLPQTYWCYSPEAGAPEPSPLRARSTNQITFGCLNNFCKASTHAWDAWTQVLQAVPNSRLIVHAHEGNHRQRIQEVLQSKGVERGRVSFTQWLPRSEYLKLYKQVDIGLDPFPCNGGTTTCNALWMGVPVVTLAGQTAVGRGGVSVLRNIGLPDLIAQTPQEYVEIAVALTKDLPRLAKLRETMRERMRASPLMDAPRFAANVEAAYRQMWREWCGRAD